VQRNVVVSRASIMAQKAKKSVKEAVVTTKMHLITIRNPVESHLQYGLSCLVLGFIMAEDGRTILIFTSTARGAL
jgi:hypothetical protein